MGLSKNHPASVPFVAVFCSEIDGLEQAWSLLEDRFGKIADLSPAFDFVESEYYHATMLSPVSPPVLSPSGSLPHAGLKKQLAVFESWYDPASMSEDKLLTNQIETKLGMELVNAGTIPHGVARPINIDPGYVSMTKLVLASTKNREHRIYLRDGIYAEVTLAFRDQDWQPMPWTYADYQRRDVRDFLKLARSRFSVAVAQRLRNEKASSQS
jgi:hypothetical protein